MSQNSDNTFDDLTDIYEAMIDWPKRLANETPFFRRHFERAGVGKVADVACGTGRHAAMFHSWGLDVRGFDISESMIARAKETFGEHETLRWAVQGFDQPIDPTGSFDAVVCIGNSLALAGDEAKAGLVVQRMLDAVRPGGVVIVHVLNIWQLEEGPVTWQKLTRKTIREQERLILKGVHRCGNSAFVDLAVMVPGDDPPSLRARSVPFLGLRAAALREAVGDAAEVIFFGNHHDQPYAADRSVDLIMVAVKRS